MIQLSIEFYDRENWFYFKMLWIVNYFSSGV